MKNRQAYRDVVGVSQLAKHWDWNSKDWINLVIIPILFLVTSIPLLKGELWGAYVVDTAIRCLGFVVLACLNVNMLKVHWRSFCKKPFMGISLVIIFAVLIQVLLSLTRAFLPEPNILSNTNNVSENNFNLWQSLFISLGPMAIVLIEEFTFRHTLLCRIPVWNFRLTSILLVLINSLVFGLIHFYNVGDVIQTLPFAAVGLSMNLLYLYTRNIWHVLLSHGLNNFILGGLMTVLLVYLMGGSIG